MHLFIMPPNHRLAGRDYIEGNGVEGEPLITCTKAPEPDWEFACLFRPTDCFPRWAATVELPEAIVEPVASDLGSNVLSKRARQSAIDEGRIVGARVTENGVDVPWNAVLRSEDKDEDDPIFTVAIQLAKWCSRPNAGFQLGLIYMTEILQPYTVPRPSPATRRESFQEHSRTHRDGS